MEKDITLRQDSGELRCPHCGRTGMTVRCVFIHYPRDGMVVSFDTTTLAIDTIDGWGGEEAIVSLTVDCPRCTQKGDAFYLELTDGNTRIRDFVARAHWSTDKGDDPNSKRMQLLKVFKEAGERGLTMEEAGMLAEAARKAAAEKAEEEGS
jgi:hypothetical protein